MAHTFAIAKYLLTLFWFCWHPNTNIEVQSIPICSREIVSACCHSNSALWACSILIWSIWAVCRWWVDYFWESNVSTGNAESIPVAIASIRLRSDRAHVNWWIYWTAAAAKWSANCDWGRSSRFHWVYWFCANALDFRWDNWPLGPIDHSRVFFVRAIRYHCCPMYKHPLWSILRLRLRVCVCVCVRWSAIYTQLSHDGRLKYNHFIACCFFFCVFLLCGDAVLTLNKTYSTVASAKKRQRMMANTSTTTTTTAAKYKFFGVVRVSNGYYIRLNFACNVCMRIDFRRLWCIENQAAGLSFLRMKNTICVVVVVDSPDSPDLQIESDITHFHITKFIDENNRCIFDFCAH